MPTVFVSNASPDHDYSSASTFGCVTNITNGNFPIFKTGRLTNEVVRSLAHSKKDDFLLLSGSSVIAGICMAAWLTLHGRVHLLLYDKKAKKYEERLIGRDNLLRSLEYERDLVFDETQGGKNG